MCTYSENIPAKFHPDSIWNDAALGFFWRDRHKQKEEQQQENNKKMSSDMSPSRKSVHTLQC